MSLVVWDVRVGTYSRSSARTYQSLMMKDLPNFETSGLINYPPHSDMITREQKSVCILDTQCTDVLSMTVVININHFHTHRISGLYL